jgi:hypothetical protein
MLKTIPMVQKLERRHRLTETGCWQWTGKLHPDGYGVIDVTLSRNLRRPRMVHRVAYELFVGPVPSGLQLDHLCRNRACFNPEHLEPVTQQENIRRGLFGILRTHCRHGHELTPENTYSPAKSPNTRFCRACGREATRRYLARKRSR